MNKLLLGAFLLSAYFVESLRNLESDVYEGQQEQLSEVAQMNKINSKDNKQNVGKKTDDKIKNDKIKNNKKTDVKQIISQPKKQQSRKEKRKRKKDAQLELKKFKANQKAELMQKMQSLSSAPKKLKLAENNY